MKMSISLGWKKGIPSKDGLYFVAVKLGEAAGTYDFQHWNGEAWESLDFGHVIAFVSIQDLKNALDIKWPEDSDIVYKSKELPGDDSELWSEG
jgi:hypothetical protein